MTPRFLARRDRTSSPRPFTRKPKYFRLGVEPLEDRLAPSAGLPPDLIVGRTQSAYSTTGVANNSLSVTYTVYNQRAEDIAGVLLTTSLQPGVTFTEATQPTDRDGSTLAWGLGTISAYGRASVTVTMTIPTGAAITLDTGARAFGTLDGGVVAADTPAASLTDRPLPAAYLVSTPDANTTDPFVQEQAARLRYDPQAIFNYLNDDVGYESYTGSLRGARGTLWSEAGNSLDEASLGVALFRARGIPARYARGTLTTPLASQLVLSMFPPNFQTVGYVPADAIVADPANDPALFAETRDHFWVQFDSGTGFTNADSSGLPGGGIGTAFTVAAETFGEVADSRRHKIDVTLDAETYNSASGLFGGLAGDGLGTSTVLTHTFSAVELVGRPISIGALVNQSSLGGLVFSSRTTTYSPYLLVGDLGLDPSEQPGPITGTNFQDVVTNFPFGSTVLTGLFLKLGLRGPGTETQHFERALVDRIGFATRQGLGGSVSVDPSGPSPLTTYDTFTLNLSAAKTSPAAARFAWDVAARERRASETNPNVTTQVSALIATARAHLAEFTRLSEEHTANLAHGYSLAAYYDSPRATLFSTTVTGTGDGKTIRYRLDLIRDAVRAVAAPGQNVFAEKGFAAQRGIFNCFLEAQIVPVPEGATNVSSIFVVQEAYRQGIPFLAIGPDNLADLATLELPAEAKARITLNVQNGLRVSVPARAVTLGGSPQVAWLVGDPETGEVLSQAQDGGNVGISEYVMAVVFGVLNAVIVLGFSSLPNVPHPTNYQIAKSFALGFSLVFIPNLFVAFLAAVAVVFIDSPIGPLSKWDPPLSPQLVDLNVPYADGPGATGTHDVTFPANTLAGPVSAGLQAPTATVTGSLSVTWDGDAVFTASAVTAATATVTDASGAVLGSGPVSFSTPELSTVTVSGPVSTRLTGTGTVSSYGKAFSSLGIVGDWAEFVASLSGDTTLTVTTDRLTLNGSALPAGTYRVRTNAATIGGRGRSNAPAFAGSATVTTANGTVTLGTNPGTYTGFAGSLSLTAGGVSVADDVDVTGTAGHVLRARTDATGLTTDQNAPVSFDVRVETSRADVYTVTAEAPPGWVVTVDATGRVSATPAPGLDPGAYSIRVSVRSTTDEALVTSFVVPVTVTAAAPGIEFTVEHDPIYTVPFAGAQIPSAYRATVRNLGPAAEPVQLTFANLPAGFRLLNSGTSMTVPAGETGFLGLYLEPITGTPLTAPGTVLTFDVMATSTTNPALTQTRTVSFTMPEVHGVTLVATPRALGVTPGASVDATVTLTAVGNVVESVTLANFASAGLNVTGLPASVALTPGQSVTVPVTLAVSDTTPLNTNLEMRITATVGPAAAPVTQSLHIPVRVAVAGADEIVTASAAADRLGNTDLANRLNELSTALTTLVQSPSNNIARSQSLAALDAVIGLVGADAYLAPLVSSLTTDRANLVLATTATQIQTAVSGLGATLEDVGDTLGAALAHRFTLAFVSNTGVARPQVPTEFSILLRNTGTQTTTYDLTPFGVPAGVGAAFSQASVTLAPGQSTFTAGNPNLTLTLTPGTGELAPFDFSVRAVARPAPAVAQSVTGSLSVRAEVVTVVSVSPTPTFADPGVPVAVSARLLNAVNREQTARVQFVVRDAAGTAVFTSTPVPASLTVLTSLTTVALGTLNTTGFALGNYTIDVTVSDDAGVPIPGATGTGHLLIGSPVTASLTTDPTSLAPGDGTVTTTLGVTNTQTNAGAAVTPLGTVAIPGANHVQVRGNRAYVAGTGGIRVVDISDPSNPAILSTFGEADIGAGLTVTGVTLDGDRLVVTTGTFPANANSRVLVYSLANPSAPALLGQSPLTFNGVDYTGTASRTVINHRLYTNTQFFRYFIAGQTVFGQYGQSLVVDVSNPTAPAPVDVVFNRPPEPDFTYPDGLRWPDGSSNIWQAAGVDATTAYLATTANTKGVVDDAGQILVVDTTNPNDPNVVRTFNVPGMSVVTGLQVVGTTAWAIGSTLGWRSGITPLGLNGKVVIARLNVADARNPVIEYTKTFDVDSLGLNVLENAGNGLFISGTTSVSGPNATPRFSLFDTSDPNNVALTSYDLATEAKYFTAGSGRLYAGDGTNFTIYEVGVPAPIELVGQAPVAGAVDAIRNGDFVYVSGTAGISVFDVAGANLANPQFVRTVGQRPDLLEIRGNLLVAVRGGLNPNSMRLDTYSLTDPSNPQFLGTTGEIPYSAAAELLVTDTHAFIVLVNLFFFVPGNDIFDQQGGVVAIDITNPAAPFLDGDAVTAAGTPPARDGVNDGVLFNDNGTTSDGVGLRGGIDQSGGTQNTWNIVRVSPTIAYVSGSSSTGGNTQAGTGLVRVVDISDPRNMRLLRDLQIPGIVQVTGIAVDGNRAFVTGSQGGWNDNRPDLSFTGNAVLAILDVSDPANPRLLRSQVAAEASRGIGRAAVVSLGNGRFAYGNQGANATDPGLFVVDTNDPGGFTAVNFDTPAEILHLTGGGNLLYTADNESLVIYRIAPSRTTPATARVTVPTADGVAVVAGSFSLPPTRTLPVAGGTTYEWDLSLGSSTTITWQSTVAIVQPGRSRPVATKGSVSFVSGGTPGDVALADQFVTGVQILGITPASQTAAPGEIVTFGVVIENPTASSVTYTLGVTGVPGSWVGLDPTVVVPANGSVTVPLTVSADAFAALAEYGLIVSATAGPVSSSVRGTLTLVGTPVLPDPDSHGVVVSLTPTTATAGPGTTATFVVRVTNTGSVTETYDLTAGLPAGVAGALSQTSVTVPPGAGNFREVLLRMMPSAGTLPGNFNFSVTAATGPVSNLAEAILTVVNRGVTVAFDRSSLAPGESATVTITNTGSVVDSFDLSLTGPAGLVSALGLARIDLAPAESRTVTVTTDETVPFAVSGAMPLSFVSQSVGNPAVRGSASANVIVPESVGLTAAFRQPSRTIAAPGLADFLLEVRNLGTGEDSYEATIIGSTGPVSASLIGINGQQSSSIPIFRLPGLSQGAITVRASLADDGTGTVTVRIRSISDPARESIRTATLGTTASPTRPTPLLVGGATNGTAIRYSPTAGQFGPGTALTFFPNFAGDVRTATADVTGDDIDDFIGGSGPGMAEVAIIDGATNQIIARFSPYEPTFRLGVFVAAADLNGDGKADVVVTPDLGGGPVVAVYDGSKLATGLANGQAFGQPAQLVRYYGIEGDPNFRGGARPALGDIDGDGTPDLMVSAGFLGGPRIALYSGVDMAAGDDTPRHLIPDFYAFEPTLRNGAFVALGDITGDGRAELVFGGGLSGGNRVRVFEAAAILAAPEFESLDTAPGQMNNFFTGDPSLRGGARVAVKFIDDSGKAALITGSGNDEAARVHIYSASRLLTSPAPTEPDQVILPFNAVLTNGAFVG